MTPTDETLSELKMRSLWIWEGKIEASPGSEVGNACLELSLLARHCGAPLTIDFSGVAITAAPDSDPQALRDAWSAEMDRRHAEYLASDRYAEQQRAAAEKEAKHKIDLAAAEAVSPAIPTWSDPEGWAKSCAANSDGYGGAVMSYAERWARLMEGEIERGVEIKDCADRLSHLADVEGITGFMYGCAVSILSQCWIHGDALRRWHNKDVQIGNEGDKANESGGVLNPALLSLG